MFTTAGATISASWVKLAGALKDGVVFAKTVAPPKTPALMKSIAVIPIKKYKYLSMLFLFPISFTPIISLLLSSA
jgi:hypothetical protein